MNYHIISLRSPCSWKMVLFALEYNLLEVTVMPFKNLGRTVLASWEVSLLLLIKWSILSNTSQGTIRLLVSR